MSDLKPCPFCGSTDLYVVQAQIEEYHSVEPEISCKKCRYTIKLKELAIAIDESPETNADWWDKGTAKKWNTRPAEDAKDKEIERLKAALKHIAYLRNLNPGMKASKFSSCAEDDLRNFYCTMGDIAIKALGTDTNVPANDTDMNDGTMEEKIDKVEKRK